MQTLIFDVEGDGLLLTLTRLHCLVIRDYEAKKTYRFRRNEVEDTMVEGVRMLEQADIIVGHNVIGYDIPAIRKIYPFFTPTGKIRDSLVMVRVSAPDIKTYDMELWKRQLLPSDFIGSHSLGAWGYRLKKHKGDYMHDMTSKGLDPWSTWNDEMELYCVNDVEITTILWEQILAANIPEGSVKLETGVHTVCVEAEQSGFPFDKASAAGLALKLEEERAALHDQISREFGERLRPEKKKYNRPLWYDPDGIQAKKEQDRRFDKLDTVWGEDKSRKWWGEITHPKISRIRNGIQYVAGAPFCKAKWTPFNPGSRQQIIDVLSTDYGWEPSEFTETGMPSVTADELKKISERIPIAKTLAELFFLTKLIASISTAPQNWIKACDADGYIHCYINVGGTVTGRCTHSKPNLGQVPGVVAVDTTYKVHDKEGKPNKKLLLPDGKFKPWVYNVDGSLPETVRNPIFLDTHGEWIPEVYDFYGNIKKEGPLLGRAGDYGWECRSLFKVPDRWVQVGVDLSGIEFRALAHLTAEFDGGELVEVVLNGDIHAYNQDKTGIPSRDIVKRILYGLLYGAGDYKLGITADPMLTPIQARAAGAQLRAQLMAGLPALSKAILKVQGESRKGHLVGLDGRLIKVRAEHTALNTRLQSDAALIAKKWLVLTRDEAVKSPAVIGWNTPDGGLGDFSIMAFVHDEIQMAAHPGFAEELAMICRNAAATAGEFFEYRCPVAAEAKLGYSWAQCH